MDGSSCSSDGAAVNQPVSFVQKLPSRMRVNEGDPVELQVVLTGERLIEIKLLLLKLTDDRAIWKKWISGYPTFEVFVELFKKKQTNIVGEWWFRNAAVEGRLGSQRLAISWLSGISPLGLR